MVKNSTEAVSRVGGEIMYYGMRVMSGFTAVMFSLQGWAAVDMKTLFPLEHTAPPLLFAGLLLDATLAYFSGKFSLTGKL